ICRRRRGCRPGWRRLLRRWWSLRWRLRALGRCHRLDPQYFRLGGLVVGVGDQALVEHGLELAELRDRILIRRRGRCLLLRRLWLLWLLLGLLRWRLLVALRWWVAAGLIALLVPGWWSPLLVTLLVALRRVTLCGRPLLVALRRVTLLIALWRP